MAYGRKMVDWDISMLELISILNFKEVIKDWMVEKQGIVIEGDNKNVISLVKQTISLKNCNKKIQKVDILFLDVFKNVIFHFTSREGNCVAIACAQSALEGDFLWEHFLLDVLPSSIYDLIRKDCDRLAIT
ncbi:hypothetical protein IEQ34_004741 [Dendrobium chrysotoxum]|uniref:RNase H type-1 domain-containing protein n=1 Tax=Dendrobium chrysotoxum TaxID=161865 RepID=A0AAV7HHI6_DENCH|nr:hypothetical protein IEQ34_004741 [Dendrobium chrysotoxum]